MIAFSITDTGAGISATDRERVFEIFAQAGEGRPAEPGTGLGLPLCRRMLALMGASLDLESELDAGSRFHFTLRLSQATARVDASVVARRVTGYTGARRRLLVVDDVMANRTLLRELLEPLGFAVAEAATGEAALALAAENTIAAVLLDLRLPGISGS